MMELQFNVHITDKGISLYNFILVGVLITFILIYYYKI